MMVLGIETSCDETSAALVVDGRHPLSNVVSSQVELHRPHGGVVPEIAARAHLENLVPVVVEALSGHRPDLIAVTVGPGLVGSLVVGVSAAKAMAWAWEVPLVGVNHLHAHIFAPVLEGALPDFPFLALVVSGGHTLLAEVRSVIDMELLGETRDDALGEAYDKVSVFLGLGYPGGPAIDEIAGKGDRRLISLPRPMISSGDFNFSLSGLKTAVIREVTGSKRVSGKKVPGPRTGLDVRDVAASFQAAALEVVVRKTVRAALDRGLSRVVIGGGVACNRALRRDLRSECERLGLSPVFPSPSLCTDNAAMVAALGYYRYLAGHRAGLGIDVYPNLGFSENMPDGRSDLQGR